MVDIGIITGSAIYGLPRKGEPRLTKNRFGKVEVTVFRAGPWTVGAISRHGKNHHHLPHTIPHRANLLALKELGAQAILATTAVGAVDPHRQLGRPIIFEDLFYPDNRLPDGQPCTIFTEPGDPERGHFVANENFFSLSLRLRVEAAAEDLGMEVDFGGVYAHTNGPRFETQAEIKALSTAGVAAVSQTCGPESVLATELGIPYALIGFPVNFATGIKDPKPKEELSRLLALSAKVLPRLLLRTAETLKEEDFAFGHGHIYRIEGGIIS